MKKTISFLLVIALFCTLLPQVVLTSGAAEISSGICTKTISWSFEANTGKLSINGIGDIPNYSVGVRNDYRERIPSTPWNTYCSLIKSVDIGNGITGIGNNSFYDCRSLETVTLPNGLKRIGSFSFYGCTSLQAIKIPDSIVEIDRCAFQNCTSLDRIMLPDVGISIEGLVFEGTKFYSNDLNWIDGVLYIGNHLVAADSIETSYIIKTGTKSVAAEALICDGLESVFIPSSLKIISGEYIPHVVYSVESNNSNYSSDLYGVLFDKNKTQIISCPENLSGRYSIPSSVRTICNSAFSRCSELISVTIPSSVSSIGAFAFSYCENLSSVSIPDSISSIGVNAFNNTSYYKNASNWTNKVLYISNSLISVKSDYSGVLSVRDGTKLIADGALTSKQITSVSIPASVISIGEDALPNIYMSYFSSISVSSGNSKYKTDDNGILYSKDGSELLCYPTGKTGTFVVPSTVRTIGNFAFKYSRIKSLTLPTGLKEIGYNAFYSCNHLKEITIPEGTSTIGNGAFSYCDMLSTVNLNEGLTEIGYEAFRGCKISTIIFPTTLEVIGYNAFLDCSVEEAYFYGDAPILGEHVFDGLNVGSSAFYYYYGDVSVFYDPKTNAWTAPLWYGYSASGSLNGAGDIQCGACGTNLQWCYDDATKELTVTGSGEMTNYPDLNTVPWHSFCESIKTVNLTSDLKSIGQNAFRQCSNLTNIVIPVGVTTIGEAAFSLCNNLKSISIPGTVKSIGDEAFLLCTNLANVIISDGVEKIGDNAFDTCSISNIEIPDSVTNIGENAFFSCLSLTNITIRNLNCTIFSGECTLGVPGTTTIYGYEGSTAQSYAEEYGYSFKPISTPPSNVGYQLRVYSSSGGFCTYIGDDYYFDVRLYHDGEVVQDWDTPAIAASDRNVLYAGIGNMHDFSYPVHIHANDAGISNVTISDSKSGASITVLITVLSGPDNVHSYWMKDVPKFDPGVWPDKGIPTNFYNLNGIYVKDFSYSQNSDKSCHVKLTAYNSNYYHGAIDIYDKNGDWYDCEQIEKFSDVSSIFDAGEYLGRILFAEDDILSYTTGTVTKESPIEFDVPAGGYFTISNNVKTSIGTYLFNATDFIIMGTTASVKALFGVDTDSLHDQYLKSVYGTFMDNKELKKELTKIALEQMGNIIIEDATGFFKKTNACTQIKKISSGFMEATKSYINHEHILGTILGVGQSAIEKLGGPFGWGLSILTDYIDYSNYIMQIAEMAVGTKSLPTYVFAPAEKSETTVCGVSVEGNGNIPDNTILQVFRLNNKDELVWFEENGIKISDYAYELYNICLIKNDKTVSPDGIITVKIKIPDGYSEGSMSLYRQEPDGRWTSIEYNIQGDYLLFYTEHFSNYVIFYPKTQDENPTDCGGNAANCPSAKFTDVAPYGDWSHNGIDFCLDRGLFGGTSATTFEPETAMNRAMLVTVLWRYEGSPTGYGNSFKDVPSGQWYTDAVAWASSNEIVNGVGGSNFDPDGIVTREQMATILYRYSDWKGFDTSKRADFSAFPDAGKVGSWAKTAMQWAVAEGLIGGSKEGGKTYILPSDGATRAQVATILMRFVQNIAGSKPHSHTWDNGVITKEATCTSEGVKTFTCTSCGETKTEKIAKIPHAYQDTVTAPTCTAQGYTTHTCSGCGDSYVNTYTSELGHNYVNGICTRCNQKEPADRIAESKISFTINYPAPNETIRAVRSAETNLGDLCADAYYWAAEDAGCTPDIAIVNGGSIRSNAEIGDWTQNTCKSIHTFGNTLCVIEITGQQLLDALEFGARFTTGDPANLQESGAFLQVAGCTFKVNTAIPNSVKVDDKNTWQGAPSAYRVSDVKIYDKASGTYKALNLSKIYRITGTGYLLHDCGDGFEMFKGGKLIMDDISEDYSAIANYVQVFTDTNGNSIADIASANSPLAKYKGYLLNYEKPEGSGRIAIDNAAFTGNFGLSTSIKGGDKVVIYNPGYGVAIRNETDNNWYLVPQTVTLADNKISNPDPILVWDVVDNGDGTFTFKNGTNAIAAYVSGTYIELTNDANYPDADIKWKISYIDGLAYIQSATLANSYGPAYIECYYNANKDKTNISGYTSSNPSAKSNDFGFLFYVKGASGEVCPHTDYVWDGKVGANGCHTLVCADCGIATKQEACTFVEGFCSVCGAKEPAGSGVFSLASSIKGGDKVVIYNPGYGVAIRNETDNNWYLVPQTVTPAGNKISDPDAILVWTVVDNGDGTFSFVNGNNAIAAYVSGTYIELTNDKNYSGADIKWKVSWTDGLAYIQSSSLSNSYGPAYIECYYNANKDKTNISGYTSSNPSAKSNDFGFLFYVKGASGEVCPHTDYVWDGKVGANGCHTLVCADCGIATKQEACTFVEGFCTVCGAEEVIIEGGSFVKVTDVKNLVDGTYLIVYETDSIAMNGALEKVDAAHNNISVAISEGMIEATDDVLAATFEIKAIDGGYSIQAAGGSFISGDSTKNTIKEGSTAVANTITFDQDGNAVIFAGGYLMFNKTSGDTNYRFRYYKAQTQQPIQLYKLNEGPACEHDWDDGVKTEDPTCSATLIHISLLSVIIGTVA